ncbi:prospero homeobox protein 2 [Podarcis raffonei]|uniref:prospero homeobox protein 2 n=1 Tax=Podarcis raffonei TaxID=65483 RepID=UPI0023292189|nr:prospero homeobox protein 2 [Podarcis raffonei]
MNGNPIADHCDYRPTSGHAGGQKGDTCVERDCFFSPASYYASIISHLLSQPEPNGELDPSFLLPSSQKTELLFQSAGNGTCSREASSPSPDCGLINSSQFHNEHLQAKRARVENIIRGMSLTPNPLVPGIQVEGDQNHLEKVKGSYRENKRKQRVPQQQSLHDISLARAGQNGIQAEECLQLKKQLHILQQQLKQLQEKFAQPHELNDSSPSQGSMEKTLGLLKEKFGQSLDSSSQGVSSGHRRDRFCRSIPKTRGSEWSEKGTRTADSHSLTSEDRALSEILKRELIQVVTQAVDSVLKQVLPESPDPQPHLPSSPTVTASSTGREFTGAAASASSKWLPKISSHKSTISVATEKLPAFPSYPIRSKMERKPCQVPPVNYPLVMTSEVQGNSIFSQMLLCGQNSPWGSPSPKMVPSPECLDRPWRPIKLKSSVMRHQRCPTPYKSAEIESLASLPASNAELAEMQAMMDGMYFPSTHIQEALTPGHLKKAKLMFFFSRYPTSSLLKTYFLDVQFTRCITSQLIKWFSNFREFYYIQMEKFARQAVLEDVTDPSHLIVTRDSELFRILNVHYNKGNDFEVPDGFLDVASLTLQEFFSAVRAGKDSDPSWKKPIYKIISKLDREIPDAFKSSTCPKELNQG